ncbi:hypothetical protein POPTR_008G194200v4 [Populus trichocarpa]|uniref:Uncharacterized protein n=1 Tax=Populus trichocarpa TaxID=3694 RepID=A0ACC0SMT8_POPTR|nr:uncharacterized protein LOC7469077 [Populus trichocarpa]KAI9390554.1 hypothetical protein POPTR_008G194200v4 [Populus trichocarpa]
MAAASTSEITEGPVLSLITKRLRGLKKKFNRIVQMEESIAQGKPINKEQEDFLRSKPSVAAAIDELEKLRQPLSVAVSEEIELAAHRLNPKSDSTVVPEASNGVVEDLLHLFYFGCLFDVRSQNDFTATMLTRTHERGCCLTYDYVTDDATDLLSERDLDMISILGGGLIISRPVNSSLSHKNALQRCMEHAKLWLANSDQPIDSNVNVSYAELREKLNKIMASDYFTTTPEIKAPVEMAAAAGNYVPFQVPFSVHMDEDSVAQYQPKEQETENIQHETGDDQSSPAEELQKDEQETENPAVVSDQEEQDNPSTEVEVYYNQREVEHGEVDHNQREAEPKEQQYVSRRNYQNQRGGRGGGNGGRRGYSNGRGGRSGGRGGGGYQTDRNQHCDQPGNYYQRNNYTNQGRGVRGGGHTYNNNGSTGEAPADVGVAS